MTFISLCIETDVFTFIDENGKAIALYPAQVFHNRAALRSLPIDFRTLLTKKLITLATKSA